VTEASECKICGGPIRTSNKYGICSRSEECRKEVRNLAEANTGRKWQPRPEAAAARYAVGLATASRASVAAFTVRDVSVSRVSPRLVPAMRLHAQAILIC
jgi:hypothetical protein